LCLSNASTKQKEKKANLFHDLIYFSISNKMQYYEILIRNLTIFTYVYSLT